MARLVNLVNVKFDPGVMERVKPIMMDNARNADLEPDCYQFDVAVAEDDQNSFIFYEIYKDKEALAAHRETSHFLAYWDLINELGDKVQRSAKIYYIVD